jgi:glycerol uptake facilitator-like aquaporin
VRAVIGEFLGTMFLLAAVVGSGIMGERLAGGNVAIALLANSLATGLALPVLILLFERSSGSHFNPLVTVALRMRRTITASQAIQYIAVQMIAAIVGVLLAHAMFDLPLVQFGSHTRTGAGQWLSEGFATCGLLLIVLAGPRRANPTGTAMMIGAYIGAAYWFTASTSFANPAVTIARSLTDTFAGIRPADILGFIVAQSIGMLAAIVIASVLNQPGTHTESGDSLG